MSAIENLVTEQIEWERRMRLALGQMESDYTRLTVILVGLGLTPKQISEVYGVSNKAVSQHIYRFRKIYREVM